MATLPFRPPQFSDDVAWLPPWLQPNHSQSSMTPFLRDDDKFPNSLQCDMMRKELLKVKWDAVIIGAGHNGLTAAAYLAKSGLSVAVLERRHLIGGATVTEEIIPGFNFSRCSYLQSLLRPSIIRELQLKRHGLKFLKPITSIFTPCIDGRVATYFCGRMMIEITTRFLSSPYVMLMLIKGASLNSAILFLCPIARHFFKHIHAKMSGGFQLVNTPLRMACFLVLFFQKFLIWAANIFCVDTPYVMACFELNTRHT